MKARTFRLEDSDIELLKQLAEARGESQSDAIRFAIQNAASAIHDEIHDETSKNEQNGSGEVVSELIRQLKVKDEQLRQLSTALVGAQETAKAAQALQAQAVMGELPEKAGEAAGEQQKRSWWRRLFG